MKNILGNIKNPPMEYKPVPFWSWNSELCTKETVWQIEQMHKAGMGGFFMHARGGLTTEYLGKEWMDNVRASIDKARELGMFAWGYDENGWPSGFGSDAVNSLGVEYQQKYLRYEFTKEPASTERTVTNIPYGGRNVHFYYDINPFYVDTLDAKVTDEFLKSTHEKYKELLGENFKGMAGFFTDEPQVSRGGMPWSFTLEAEYERAYGEALLPRLCDLFFDTEGGERTRFRFWKLITQLFSESFMGRIYSWCEENGVRLTGHAVCEEGHTDALESNGAIMPNYEYMHIPGIDKLTLEVNRYLLTPQVTSVCAQLGRKQILTESFALCGWDVSFEELKHIYEWQMVKGVNLLCQHLVPYTIEGLRKRDYPAGHFYQNPWWDKYKIFNDFASRMGMLLAEGEIRCEVLVLHTMSSAWVSWFGDEKRAKCDAIQNDIFSVITALDKNQIIYHLGDDKIMKKYARIENGRFIIGKMSYSTVIVPQSICIDSHTLSLLEEFQRCGGRVIFIGNLPSLIDGEKSDYVKGLCKICADDADGAIKLIPESAGFASIRCIDGTKPDIQLCVRKFDDFDMYYFVNTFGERADTVIEIKGKSAAQFDYLTGEVVPVCFTEENGVITICHTFEKMGSAVFFIRSDDGYKSKAENAVSLSPINERLRGRWEIEETDDNIITLDKCDVYFDGELKEKNIYVLDIQQLACDLRRKVKIAMDFDVNFDRRPVDRLQLVIERPENYTIYINGKVIDKAVAGYYRDKAFKVIDVTGKFEIGYNILTLECDFEQSGEVYDTLDNCTKFESVKNKLYYDMEIEPVYLIGEFAVNSSEEFIPCGGGGHKTSGNFSLTKRPFHINDGDIVPQGFPFFSGIMKLSKEITLSADEILGRSIEFSRLCSIITTITVNGKALSPIYWAPYTANLDGLLIEGENVIEIELIASLQNMLGSHHLGENPKCATPSHFHSRRDRIWGNPNNERWDESSYSFSGVGIFLK